MYKIDFQCPVHVHFIGIGGISMSGLAEILLKEHFTVTGSDSKESPLTRHLTDLGAVIHYGQKAENTLMILMLSSTPLPCTQIILNLLQQKNISFRCLPVQNCSDS